MHRSLFPLLGLIAFAGSARADIVINEILPNPDGSDTGTERLEIYNNGPDAIDVTGWAIDDAATIDEASVRARIPEDFDTASCPGSAIIQPGEYRVIKGQSTNPFLNNSGDDIYLITDRTVTPNIVDVVTYGSAPSGDVWACLPDGSENFDWRDPSLCATNGEMGDVTPPATITDLTATGGMFPGEVELSWTATGDDGTTGMASEYVIKVSTSAIDAGNFDAATDLDFWINEPVPANSGTMETVLVGGLDTASTFFFAVVAVDDASNESGVSNSPSTMSTPGDPLDTNHAGLNTYFGNLHSHTAYSDGELTPADAYNYARFTAQTPLDFLHISDHNHSGAGMSLPNYALGLAQADAANDEGNFVALYGQEFGLSVNGHCIVVGAPTLFGWEGGNFDVFVAEGDYASLYTEAKNNPPSYGPPVALWAHPASGDFNNVAVTADSDVVSLICLVNGPAFSTAEDESDVGNTGFDDVYQDALRIGNRVSPTGDQDNHFANWGASTESRTAVLAPSLTRNSLMTAMSEGRTYSTQDNNVVVGFSADGNVMGEAFSSASGIRLSVEALDPDGGDSIDQIELYRGITGISNAQRVAFNVGNTRLDWRETSTFGDGTEVHYYVRIRQADGQQIWTAPAYVTYEPSTGVADFGVEPRLHLHPVWPNPLSADATLHMTLPDDGGFVTLDLMDANGRILRRILRDKVDGGNQTVQWDGMGDRGTALDAGVYFLRLSSPRLGTHGRKVVVVR